MQTDNLSLRRIHNNGIQMLATLLLCLLLLPSCTGEEYQLRDATPDKGKQCRATLRLDVASFGIQQGHETRGYVAANPDEERIRDIWVFQYDAASGVSLKTPVYLGDLDPNNISVELTQNEGGSRSVVCIVANTGDDTWTLDENGNTRAEFLTYESFLQQKLPEGASTPFLSSNMGETGNTIPMFGVSKEMEIASKCYVSVPMIRMFARVEVTTEVANFTELGMEVGNLSFSNIPCYCRVGSLSPAKGDAAAGTYPDDIEWGRYDDAGATNEAILYIPENLQGKVADMTSKAEASAGQFPDKALKIEFSVSYNEGKNTHTYTVYPGLDTRNDFNIKRNHIYHVKLKITKLPE